MPRARKKPETIESLSASVASLTDLVRAQGRRIEMICTIMEDIDETVDSLGESIRSTNVEASGAIRAVAGKVREVIDEINEGNLLAGELIDSHHRLSDRVEIAEGRITTTQVVFGSVLRGAGYGRVIDGVEKELRERAAVTPDVVPESATVIPMRRPIQA